MSSTFSPCSLQAPGRSVSSDVLSPVEETLLGLDAGGGDVHLNAQTPDGLENLWQVGVPSQWKSDVLVERTAIAARVSPAVAGDHPKEIHVPAACLWQSRASSFVLTVGDDGMNGAGILQGDQVIVDRSLVAEHGHIVVALVDGRYLVARLFRFNGRMELRAQGMGRAATHLSCDANALVWGVVVAVLRSYAPGAVL